jgi:hypothetical protein
LKKENTCVTKTIKQERPPQGMALVETAQSRWFAACASFLERPPRVYLLQDPPLIPPALDTFRDTGPDFDCREEARASCYAWCEAVELTEVWQALAARTEVYPERTAWYLDEIAHLAGDDRPRLRCGISVQAVVLARHTPGDDDTQFIAASGNTPDEAIELLYQHVYEWFHAP